MANTMTPAQQQQQAAIDAVLARQKADARTPKTGGPAPEMPVVGGTPKVSPADKAKAAAELARKIAANKPIPLRPASPFTPSTPNKPVLPTPTKPIAPPVTPIAPKPTTGIPDLDSPMPYKPTGPKPITPPVITPKPPPMPPQKPMSGGTAPYEPPVESSANSFSPMNASPAVEDGLGSAMKTMGMKRGGNVQTTRISTATRSKKSSNW